MKINLFLRKCKSCGGENRRINIYEFVGRNYRLNRIHSRFEAAMKRLIILFVVIVLSIYGCGERRKELIGTKILKEATLFQGGIFGNKIIWRVMFEDGTVLNLNCPPGRQKLFRIGNKYNLYKIEGLIFEIEETK